MISVGLDWVLLQPLTSPLILMWDMKFWPSLLFAGQIWIDQIQFQLIQVKIVRYLTVVLRKWIWRAWKTIHTSQSMLLINPSRRFTMMEVNVENEGMTEDVRTWDVLLFLSDFLPELSRMFPYIPLQIFWVHVTCAGKNSTAETSTSTGERKDSAAWSVDRVK